MTVTHLWMYSVMYAGSDVARDRVVAIVISATPCVITLTVFTIQSNIDHGIGAIRSPCLVFICSLHCRGFYLRGTLFPGIAKIFLLKIFATPIMVCRTRKTREVQVDIGYKVGGYSNVPSIVIPFPKFESITVHFN